jgi:hypothetical protein
MQQSNATREDSVYRLLLMPVGSRSVLGRVDGSTICLPQIHIPLQGRRAREIQRAVRDRWGVDIVVLDFLKNSNGLPICAVAQMLSQNCLRGLTPVTPDAFPISELDHCERKAVDEISAGHTGDRGPLSRVGWIDEAKDWIARETGRALPPDTTIEQHNAGGGFALLRFVPPASPAYWLKATAEPNAREIHITVRLAEICPRYLPRLIATRREWNSWIMEDAGEALSPTASPLHAERAAVAIAELQKSTLRHTGELLAAGATDQRLGVLRQQVGKHIAYLEEAMEQQISTKALRLSARRLQEIGSILGNSCAAMEMLRIPDTIIHNDINGGNILLHDDRCVLTDWSEASIGNPFISCQGLLLLFPLDGNRGESVRTQVMQTYEQCWLDYFEAWKVQLAFQLMPLLAIYSHLVGRGGWMDSARARDPEFQGYARILARIIDREASSPLLLEALCR